jgi:predicted HicB family RNase H-like nuclease
MSKYSDLIKEARKVDSQPPGQPENQKSGMPDEKEPEVNLSIRVPKALRRHWVAEAKRQDTTLTAVIIEALKEKFGEPA